MKTVLFAYNPLAGTARVKKNLFEIVDFYDKQGYLVTLCPAIRLREWEAQLFDEEHPYDLVVCSGGDGTLNLVTSFLLEREKHIKLGYIPSGSTNDFAYSLGISEDLTDALEQTLSPDVQTIDVGRFGDRYFLYVAAFGIFTKVSYSTSQKRKNLLGRTAYLLEGIKEISDLKSYHLKLMTEDACVEGDFILGMVTNSLSIGGFKTLLPPNVSLSDGKFEILMIRRPSNLMELRGIISALLGEKENSDHIVQLKASKVQIEAAEPIAWTLDGEYGGEHSEMEIVNDPCKLKMVRTMGG